MVVEKFEEELGFIGLGLNSGNTVILEEIDFVLAQLRKDKRIRKSMNIRRLAYSDAISSKSAGVLSVEESAVFNGAVFLEESSVVSPGHDIILDLGALSLVWIYIFDYKIYACVYLYSTATKIIKLRCFQIANPQFFWI